MHLAADAHCHLHHLSMALRLQCTPGELSFSVWDQLLILRNHRTTEITSRQRCKGLKSEVIELLTLEEVRIKCLCISLPIPEHAKNSQNHANTHAIAIPDILEPGTWMQDADIAYIAYICQPSFISVVGLRMGRSHSDCLCTGSAGESIPGNHISKRLCPFWSRETSEQFFCYFKKRKSEIVDLKWMWLPVHSERKIKCHNL